jgi:hypothetical protein
MDIFLISMKNYSENGEPNILIDGKNKKLIGNFKNDGQE